MSNITKNLNIYKDVTSLIGMRSWGKEDLIVPYRQLNGTKVGSPTVDENCVVTNFSNSRYIYTTPFTFNDTTDTFKVDTYVKLSSLSVYTFIFTASSTSRGAATQDSMWKINSSNGNQTGGNFATNRWYHLVLEQTGDSSVLYVDGQAIINAGKCFNSGDYINFGKSNWEPFYNGFIDFSRTSIQINGEEVWRGTKGLSQISRNDMQNYVLDGIATQPVVGDSKAVIDFSNVKLPWKFEHSDKMQTSRFAIAPLGTTVTQPKCVKDVNGTIIGSPTITEDFVVSGFSISNYIQAIPPAFSSANNWEIKLKARTSNTTSPQIIYHARAGNDNNNRCGIMVVFEEGKFHLLLSSNNSTWDIGNVLGNTYLANTDYYIKVSFNGSKYELKYSTDDINYTTTISITSSKKVYNSLHYANIGSRPDTTAPLIGSIDLKECYVKLDSVEVWSGTKWVATEEMETLQGCIRYYYGEGAYVTTPPRDSTQYYNIYAVNGDEGVVLDSTYYHEGTMVYNRPIVTGGEIPQFENEWYLGEYRVDTGEEGYIYIPIDKPDTAV